MASLGKLFTSTIVGLLHDRDKLTFDDPIADYLDPALIDGLHVYRGTDYSRDIQIRHLLNQTSGLPDNFSPLLNDVIEDRTFEISPRQAVEWTKEHGKPHRSPGKRLTYTDTNYHLLGLIIENITSRPFYQVLRERIFEPLDMKHSWMLHHSDPIEEPSQPMAGDVGCSMARPILVVGSAVGGS